jgi:hypothetical protein
MNKTEFLNKLSQVADWEWREVKGQSDDSIIRKPYGESLGIKPLEVSIKNIKYRPCAVSGLEQRCYWHLKIYNYSRQKLRIKRCITCGLTITPEGNTLIVPVIDVNLALKVILHDREVKNNK